VKNGDGKAAHFIFANLNGTISAWDEDPAALIQVTTRETLAKHYPAGRPSAAPRPNPVQEKLLGRYLEAWQGHNVGAFVALLKEEATVTMPPWREWYSGRDAIGSFFGMAWKSCKGLRLVPAGANGQPAFAVYERTSGADGHWSAHSIHVLALDDERISTVTMFVPPTGPNLFQAFGFPQILRNHSVPSNSSARRL
jgi:RNA polymerase sigma-70 factor, ECF subfamily